MKGKEGVCQSSFQSYFFSFIFSAKQWRDLFTFFKSIGETKYQRGLQFGLEKSEKSRIEFISACLFYNIVGQTHYFLQSLDQCVIAVCYDCRALRGLY